MPKKKNNNKEKKYFGDIEILDPICNFSTIIDGRGGIFSWIPDENIKEWSLLYCGANKVRGNHYHPEFTEYCLVISGAIVLVTIDPKTKKQINMLMGQGMCFKTPPNVPHAVYSIEASVYISFITKKWNDCKNPIIFQDLISFDDKYNKYDSK